MKKLVSKLIGGLGVVALVVGSFTSTANAQPVSMDEVQITEVGNLEEVAAAGDWAIVTRDFFVYGESRK